MYGLRAVDKPKATNVLDQSSQNDGNTSSQEGKNDVVFDGKNYIKKSGWTVPTRQDTYVGQHAWNNKTIEKLTANGTKVKVIGKQFLYGSPLPLSEEFSFDGDGLDFMKGNIMCYGFFEDTANGKVFRYTIYIQKEQPAGVSNTDRKGPTQYEIHDNDGDAIFETLLGDGDEFIVPNWVLK